MRHLTTITILALLCLFASCAAKREYKIGMTKEQFKKENKDAVLVEAMKSVETYRVTDKDFLTRFFMFKGDTLKIITEGTRQPDILIQNTH